MTDRYDIIQGHAPEPKDDEKEVQPKTPSSGSFLGSPINTSMMMRPLGSSEGVAISLDDVSLTYVVAINRIHVNTEFTVTMEEARALFEKPTRPYADRRPPGEGPYARYEPAYVPPQIYVPHQSIRLPE